MAVGGVFSVFTSLLMVLSARAQCQDRGFNLAGSDIAELYENVRLGVECNETEAKLSLSSGGIYVDEVFVFQDCVTGNDSDVIARGESILYDYLASTMDEREIPAPPNSEILMGADLECSYYGCYIADSIKYNLPYVLQLRTATKCTFTKEAASSSSLPRHTETSMNTATLTYHTSTQRMASTAVMRSMQHSSISALKLQSTPVTLSNEELTSISYLSPDTPPPPTHTAAIQGNGNASLQWMALLILFPVALLTLLGFCLVLRRVDMRQDKIKLQEDIHTEWTKWQSEEPLDVNFLPVLIDLQLKSPSLYSLDTVLNELDCSSTSSPHTTLPGNSNSVKSTSKSHKIMNGSISCESNVGQDSDTEGEEHLQDLEPQTFHTTRSRVIDENQAENFHPTVAASERSLTQILDPAAAINAYNYSMDSREYVLVSSISCSGGSGSTTFTTIGSHHEDLCVPAQHNNDTSCDSILS